MNIDEAIKHCLDVAKENDKLCKRFDDASGYTRSGNKDIRTTDAKKCEKCAEEHRQLAEWLKELKELREQTRWIPVRERLPYIDTAVLVDDGVDRFVAWYVKNKFDEGWDSYDGSYNPTMSIKAWMPLPQPYNKTESEEDEINEELLMTDKTKIIHMLENILEYMKESD